MNLVLIATIVAMSTCLYLNFYNGPFNGLVFEGL